jgi:Dolichyl-phosphate-mannose-protein mannosyltransferase
MSTAAADRYDLRARSEFAPALCLAGLTVFLFVRLFPDITGKPLYEDEAVAGLISARPLGDLLHTVVLDRGGAPLHFVLAHFALAIDGNPDALRWLSVVFALVTVPLCFDLARRLSGRLAGLTAASLAATSQLLAVYGTFGRMYSLFACASALSADLFVRALACPRRRTVLPAAAASLLPLAVHPFGVFLVAAELVVALWLWRGRDLRAALPIVAVGLLAVPLVLADLRLSDRYAPEAGLQMESGTSATDATLRALGGAAGGRGPLFVVFVTLAALGAFALSRRRASFAAFACFALAAPPVALSVANATGSVSDRLGPRHLIFMFPVWIALVAAGAARLASLLPAGVRVVPVAAVTVAALVAPSAVSEPRTIATGEQSAVAAPAAWLGKHVARGDVLYPYSPVFLAALPRVAQARGYSREPVALARAVRRTHKVPAVFISLPLRQPIGDDALAELHRSRVVTHAFQSWLIVEVRGPYPNGRSALAATASVLGRASPLVAPSAPKADAFLQQLRAAACEALVRLRASCG